ncbi:MAG TPA: hypothetical protein VGP91_18045 [Actinoplanes sp.]|nr:hypothetical protein [Actinoplanes sp.]
MDDDRKFATLDDLLVSTLEAEPFELPNGMWVRIRPLSRFEVMVAQKLRQEQGIVALEVRMIASALVEPAMSDADVRRFMKAVPAGFLEPLTRRINVISGLGGDEVDREIADEFRGGSGAGVRALPGDEAGEDGTGDRDDDE